MDAANGVGLFKTVLIKMAGATGKASACPSQVTKPVHGTMVEIVAGNIFSRVALRTTGEPYRHQFPWQTATNMSPLNFSAKTDIP